MRNFKWILLNEKLCILIQIPLKFVPDGPIMSNSTITCSINRSKFNLKLLHHLHVPVHDLIRTTDSVSLACMFFRRKISKTSDRPQWSYLSISILLARLNHFTEQVLLLRLLQGAFIFIFFICIYIFKNSYTIYKNMLRKIGRVYQSKIHWIQNILRVKCFVKLLLLFLLTQHI